MNKHRFILQPYKGIGSRHTCPACHKRHCFTRYIDTEKQISFPDDVGRCDHEQSCGYHYSPKEYFEHNPAAKPMHSDFVAPSVCRAIPTEPRKTPSIIPAETVLQTLHGYENNNLYLFLRSKFGTEDALLLMKDYRVGTSKHWPGSCVFWQTDVEGKTHTGKVMLYNSDNGKRVKYPFNHVTWVHSLLRLTDFNLRQCFFGEHLLPKNRGKPVAIVESEKTALVASYYLPEYIWLATGGKNGCFNTDALSVLKGYHVILYPDLGATDHWRQKLCLLRNLGIQASIFNFLEDVATDDERTAGLDIADYLLQIEPDQAILQAMIRHNPMLQKLIDELQCNLVSVERYNQITDTINNPSKSETK
ncbi:MAG: hypothetical protein K2N48_06095 [Muribaculaceae bacterium]|nr:hypothetical protein [Muribaculaceae bacterium]